MARKVVADTSAFMMGPGFSGEDEVHVPPGVERELAGKGLMGGTTELIIRVATPSGTSMDQVAKAARATGDDARLSPTDMEVLALALDTGLPIMTDDYSIQNMASHMGLKVEPVSERGITEERRWSYRCKGCRRTFDKKMDECPICGSEVRSGAPKKASGISKHRR
jgi:UPF0271 protein